MSKKNRASAALALAVLLSADVAGQGRTVIDLSPFGWGVIAHPVAIDTDGNPGTQEWLVGPVFSTRRRVVAVQRDGQLCVGDWIDIPHDAVRQTIHGVTKFTLLLWPQLVIIDLHHPAC